MARRKPAAAVETAATEAPAAEATTDENLSGMTVASEIEGAKEAEERDGAVIEDGAEPKGNTTVITAPKARTPRPKPDFTFDEAKAHTALIYKRTGDLFSLLEVARDRRAWAVIGYTSFEDYMRTEFDFGERYANRLINQGNVIKHLSKAAGAPVKVSERQARDIGPNIDAVAADVAAAAATAADPAAAAIEVVEAHRAPAVNARRQRAAERAAAEVLSPSEIEANRRRDERAAERAAAREQDTSTSTDPTTALLAAIERLNDATEALLHCSTSGIDPTTAAIVAEAMSGHLDVVANWHRQFRNEVIANHAIEQQAGEALSEQMQTEAEAQASATANGAVTPEQAEVIEAEMVAEAVATGVIPDELAANVADPTEF